jgi:hypothetical protein
MRQNCHPKTKVGIMIDPTPHLTVFLKIPFDSESLTDSHTAITFTHWLPVGRDQGICVQDGGIRILLWFDEKCTWWVSQPTADELKKYVNINARFVYADIQVSGLRADLLEYMQAFDFSKPPGKEDEPLQVEYIRVAREVLISAIHRVNRLIAFARSHKGQYWLSDYKIDSDRLRSYFIAFEGRGQVDDGPVFRFQPSQTDVIRVTTEGNGRYVTESDWSALCEFVMGGSKPQLIGELLAGSEHLLSIGHYRSAITEAVTALEVAIFRFAGNCNADRAFSPHMAQRLALSSLRSQVDHLGLSATVNYLLPAILPEELLPASVISECQFALSRRQTIVHNGQRNVPEGDARRAVSGIRACCQILEKVTDIP